ncbi:MAG TPA: hypothetical protein HA272_04700 [Methanoregula sp.]|nr:hypothetical protein [Methanoregula sp.]
MSEEKPRLITTVSILTRRLKEKKTCEDFRRVWFHTTGFGVEGEAGRAGAAGGTYAAVSRLMPVDPRLPDYEYHAYQALLATRPAF